MFGFFKKRQENKKKKQEAIQEAINDIAENLASSVLFFLGKSPLCNEEIFIKNECKPDISFEDGFFEALPDEFKNDKEKSEMLLHHFKMLKETFFFLHFEMEFSNVKEMRDSVYAALSKGLAMDLSWGIARENQLYREMLQDVFLKNIIEYGSIISAVCWTFWDTLWEKYPIGKDEINFDSAMKINSFLIDVFSKTNDFVHGIVQVWFS